MFPIAHVGITLFLASLFSLPFVPVVITVLLPDLIDKPLKFLGIAPCGRFVAHTLLAGVLVCGAVYLVSKKKFNFIHLLFGYYVHILLDFPYVPWLYPFVGYDFRVCPPFPRYGLYALITDVLGLISLIILFRRNSRFRGFVLNLIDGLRARFWKRKIH